MSPYWLCGWCLLPLDECECRPLTDDGKVLIHREDLTHLPPLKNGDTVTFVTEEIIA